MVSSLLVVVGGMFSSRGFMVTMTSTDTPQ
jgi:hypothetical protein